MGTATDLQSLGFRLVGDWSLDSRLKSGVRSDLTAYADKRAIYAFVVDGGIKYIGACEKSGTTLLDRMKRYQSMTGGGTNEKNAKRIREALGNGSSVTIFAWCPDADYRIGSLKVDLIKGLENPLIKAFDPDWNFHD